MYDLWVSVGKNRALVLTVTHDTSNCTLVKSLPAPCRKRGYKVGSAESLESPELVCVSVNCLGDVLLRTSQLRFSPDPRRLRSRPGLWYACRVHLCLGVRWWVCIIWFQYRVEGCFCDDACLKGCGSVSERTPWECARRYGKRCVWVSRAWRYEQADNGCERERDSSSMGVQN